MRWASWAVCSCSIWPETPKCEIETSCSILLLYSLKNSLTVPLVKSNWGLSIDLTYCSLIHVHLLYLTIIPVASLWKMPAKKGEPFCSALRVYLNSLEKDTSIISWMFRLVFWVNNQVRIQRWGSRWKFSKLVAGRWLLGHCRWDMFRGIDRLASNRRICREGSGSLWCAWMGRVIQFEWRLRILQLVCNSLESLLSKLVILTSWINYIYQCSSNISFPNLSYQLINQSSLFYPYPMLFLNQNESMVHESRTSLDLMFSKRARSLLGETEDNLAFEDQTVIVVNEV